MSLAEKIVAQTEKSKKTIVLTNGSEPNMIQAAVKITQNKIANIILLGNKNKISKANTGNINLSGIKIIDPDNSKKLNEYANIVLKKQKSRDITLEQAIDICRDPLYYAIMMVNNNEADGIMAFDQYLQVLKQSK